MGWATKDQWPKCLLKRRLLVGLQRAGASASEFAQSSPFVASWKL